MDFLKEIINFDLFHNMTEIEIKELLIHGNYYVNSYDKGIEIYNIENKISFTGIILNGEIDVVQLTINGDEEMVGRNFAGDLIGPAFCITGQTNYISHFISANRTSILFLNLNKILSTPNCNSYYTKFVSNITNILANTNIILIKKIQLLTQKSLREKLLTYFVQLSEKNKSSTFQMPFTREQLAQYICSERSSVSRELGRMQDEGLIQIDGHNITLQHC